MNLSLGACRGLKQRAAFVKCFAGTVRVDGGIAGSPARASWLFQVTPLDYTTLWLGERVVQVKDLPG